METWHNQSTDELCEALLSLTDKEECYRFLEDVCTIKEILDMSQRLAVAKMLDNGANYAEIGKATGASTATISRISKCYEYGSGGYKAVIEKGKQQKKQAIDKDQ